MERWGGGAQCIYIYIPSRYTWMYMVDSHCYMTETNNHIVKQLSYNLKNSNKENKERRLTRQSIFFRMRYCSERNREDARKNFQYVSHQEFYICEKHVRRTLIFCMILKVSFFWFNLVNGREGTSCSILPVLKR